MSTSEVIGVRSGFPVILSIYLCRHFWKVKFWNYNNYYRYFRYIK